MWIRRLTLTNFRGFASLDLDLDRPLTVLVGVNGSGKSSVLRALAACQQKWLRGNAGLTGLQSAVLDGRDVRVGASKAVVECCWREASRSVSFSLSCVDKAQPWFGALRDDEEVAVVFPTETLLFVGASRHVLETAVAEHHEGPHTTVTPNGDVTVSGWGAWGFASLVAWFKDREDAENALRVQKRDLDLQHPQLRAVREAVAALMPGFTNLRIERDPSPAMVVTKGDVELRLDQLSDGERNLIALAGDLARRLVIANPEHPSPRETEAVILIDEVEQHLHPALQRKVIPSLQRAFPKAQLIVTTHSPQVLSSVPASSVVVLDHFEALSVRAPTQGRDTNAILREVFGVSERPEEEVTRIRAIAGLIDEARLDEARAALLTLADKLSESDDDVQRLRTRLDFAEAGL